MRILQINTTVNTGSTGRIAENIGNAFLDAGHQSYIAFGRGSNPSSSKKIKIGTDLDLYVHGAKTLLTDRHGFGSRRSTQDLIDRIEAIQPDAIGLHNLHGYYLNIEVLFNFLARSNIPVVWTLFDCWAFTGHCTYFDDVRCEKWKVQCNNCPKTRNYPRSFVDGSAFNYKKKKELFTGLKNLEIITHSGWLTELVKASFLKEYKVHVTPSAIDLEVFKPNKSGLALPSGLKDKKVILGCANIWSFRKGFDDFLNLHEILDQSKYQIVMIGLNKKEINVLPHGIMGFSRTESIEELARWYSLAHVFVNPTSQDNFPTTNLEALACGTPVITYNTGGSPEAIDDQTGFVIEKGDVHGILKAIQDLDNRDYTVVSKACRARAERLYDKKTRYQDYLEIFESLIARAN